MGKYKVAKNKYGISKKEWKSMKKEYGGAAGAFAKLGMKDEFDKQNETIDEREALWQKFADEMDKLIEESPEYETPQIIDDVVENTPTYAANIRNIYVEAGNNLEAITAEKLQPIIDKVVASAEIVRESGKLAYNEILEGTSGYLEQGEKALESKLEGVKGYKDIYGQRASRSGLPGEGILKRDLEGTVSSTIGDIVNYGGGAEGSTSLASVYEGSQEQLRKLAIGRASYLDEAQKDYGNALLTGGQVEGQAYDEFGNKQLISGQERARGQLAIGETEAQASSMVYGAEMSSLNTELDVTKQAGLLKAMGYETEANMLTQNAILGASYEDKEFQINKAQPYANKLDYYNKGIVQYDPFAAKQQLQADEAGLEYALYQGAAEKTAQNKKMLFDLFGTAVEKAGDYFGGK